MESLQQVMEDMQTSFTVQLAEFQRSLERATPTNTVASLAAEFSSFKKFILASLTNLQNQADLLKQEYDRLEMRGRRKILLVHGVPEIQDKDKDTGAVVTQIFSEHLNISLPLSALSRCHRMGKASQSKTRPVLVKFRDVADRDKLWFAKTLLKGSGITLSEFLTKMRHDTFMEARKRIGVSKCWTKNGIIVITAPDGSHRRITTMGELDKIVPDIAAAVQSTPVAGPSRDAANSANIKPPKRKK